MKYSLLVVDDEKIIREGVGKYIEKHCPRVSVDGLFADGAEVIEYLESNHAHIIISDIKMAGITGLELAKYVSMTKPHIKMIILSGYKKFEYAKEAMEYNVEEYLLKPVSNSAIVSAVEAAVRKIDSEKELSDKLEQYDEIISDMRSKFFIDLTFGGFGSEISISSEFDKLGFGFDYSEANAFVCSISFDETFFESWTYGRDGATTAIMNFLNQSEHVLYSTKLDDDLYLVISRNHDADAICTQVVGWAKEALKTGMEFECIYSAEGIDNLQNYSVMNVRNFEKIDDSVKIQIFKLMNSYLNLGMIENARELFCQLNNELTEEKTAELVNFLYSNMYSYDNSLENHEKDASPEKAFAYLCDHVQKSGEREDALIQKIKEFINKNYSSDITLESVANKVYLHSVYVSRYFKQHTGTNFSDYLFNVRMTHAVDLLKTNKYKISKVGEMVGYRNYKYFSKQFKNYTGFTPKRYFREVWFVNVSDDE